MTTIQRLLGRPPEVLPEDLRMLTERQIRSALEQRETRMKRLAEQGRRARGDKREATLAELRETVDDVKRLQAATPASDLDYRPSEETAWKARTGQLHVGTTGMPEGTKAERAIKLVVSEFVLPRELSGVRLDPAKLSEEEASELFVLLDRRAGLRAPAWDDEAQERFEAIIETAAGSQVFHTMREDADLAVFVEEVRRSTLPKRRVYAEVGSVTIPTAVFDALRRTTQATRGRTLADIAALAALLHTFDTRDAGLIERASFEGDVLVGKGRELRFVSGTNPPYDGSEQGRVRIDLDALADEGWFTVRREGGRIEVRLGLRARELREEEAT